jgi:hypothetical protein
MKIAPLQRTVARLRGPDIPAPDQETWLIQYNDNRVDNMVGRQGRTGYASKRSGFSNFQASVFSALAIFSMLSIDTFRSQRSTELT